MRNVVIWHHIEEEQSAFGYLECCVLSLTVWSCEKHDTGKKTKTKFELVAIRMKEKKYMPKNYRSRRIMEGYGAWYLQDNQ